MCRLFEAFQREIIFCKARTAKFLSLLCMKPAAFFFPSCLNNVSLGALLNCILYGSVQCVTFSFFLLRLSAVGNVCAHSCCLPRCNHGGTVFPRCSSLSDTVAPTWLKEAINSILTGSLLVHRLCDYSLLVLLSPGFLEYRYWWCSYWCGYRKQLHGTALLAILALIRHLMQKNLLPKPHIWCAALEPTVIQFWHC